MKTASYHLELITPCFCGGAEPEKQAEIRAPSIRGQLRWWFRVLGGFRSLAPMPVREQEAIIFGSTAGESGKAGKLVVRTSITRSVVAKNADDLHWEMGRPLGYLGFPFRPQKDRATKRITDPRKRGILEPKTRFELHLVWRGEPGIWEDIAALVRVFSDLGSLGSRARRAMGAMRFLTAKGTASLPQIDDALARFQNRDAITIRELESKASGSDASMSALGEWLQSWSSHGRSVNNEKEKTFPGYEKAKLDHDAAHGGNLNIVYRAAIGMPRLTKYGDWNQSDQAGGGRFASPVLLRPYVDDSGKWHPLVIFVDALAKKKGDTIFFKRDKHTPPRTVPVSPALYEAMKADDRLHPFP